MNPRLGANLDGVRARIGAACRRAGRAADSVRLVAVTKSAPVEACLALAEAGQLDLGENRAQALDQRSEWIERHRGGGPDGAAPVRWHFLGHLQRNKARLVVERARTLHSVDSLALVDLLDGLCERASRRLQVFLEVDFSGAPGRTGFDARELPAAVDSAARRAHLDLVGLMTMAPLPPAGAGPPAAEELARRAFDGLARCREALPADAFSGGRASLSMGMSGDFELAIAAGSDLVRVGSALFEGVEFPSREACA